MTTTPTRPRATPDTNPQLTATNNRLSRSPGPSRGTARLVVVGMFNGAVDAAFVKSRVVHYVLGGSDRNAAGSFNDARFCGLPIVCCAGFDKEGAVRASTSDRKKQDNMLETKLRNMVLCGPPVIILVTLIVARDSPDRTTLIAVQLMALSCVWALYRYRIYRNRREMAKSDLVQVNSAPGQATRESPEH
jgi:hypothetical protein